MLRRDRAILGACLVLIGIVGYLDHVTGIQIRLYPLYFIPIALTAWHVSRAAAVLLATIATLMWHRANFGIGTHDIATYVLAINTITQLVAFVTIGVLFAEVRKRLRRESDLSRLDALTSVFNARGFYERAEVLIALARRGERPFTLAYVDLDNFKMVNDAHGHGVGDQALQLVTQVMRTSLRASDLVGRLGGDEFAALLPDTPLEDSKLAIERVREAIVGAMTSRGWPVTASIGAITFSSAPATLEEAVRAADRVMYEVKRDGKNRVRFAMSEPVLAVAPSSAPR